MEFPTGLSMLWESVDAEEAFANRFGFADFDEGVAWLSTTLADRWALTLRRCERIVVSGQNAIAWVETAESPRFLICKWSRAEALFAKLAATTDLIASLAERGVPVAPPILAGGGAGREVVDGPSGPSSVSVQPVMNGGLLDVDDDLAVRDGGVHLARLHRAMADLSDSPVRNVAGTPELDLPTRVSRWLSGPNGPAIAEDRLRREIAQLPAFDAQPQLVHNDYRAGNLVTQGSAIHAILDFDEIAWDYAVSDLAHAGVFLGTLFREWGPTSDEARALLVEGYETVQTLTEAEHRWLGFLTWCYSSAAGWPLSDAPEA